MRSPVLGALGAGGCLRAAALRQKLPWFLTQSGDSKCRTLPLSCVLMRWDRVDFALESHQSSAWILADKCATFYFTWRRRLLVRSTRRDQGYDHLRCTELVRPVWVEKRETPNAGE